MGKCCYVLVVTRFKSSSRIVACRAVVLIIGTLSGMDHTEKGQGKTASLATPLVVTLGDGELLHTPHTWTCTVHAHNVLLAQNGAHFFWFADNKSKTPSSLIKRLVPPRLVPPESCC